MPSLNGDRCIISLLPRLKDLCRNQGGKNVKALGSGQLPTRKQCFLETAGQFHVWIHSSWSSMHKTLNFCSSPPTYVGVYRCMHIHLHCNVHWGVVYVWCMYLLLWVCACVCTAHVCGYQMLISSVFPCSFSIFVLGGGKVLQSFTELEGNQFN